MGISDQSVKNHVAAIFERIGVNDWPLVCREYGRELMLREMGALRAGDV